jgi:translation elongation factor P/translation initiation factor 5A
MVLALYGIIQLINKIVGTTRTTASDSLRSCTREMQSVEYFDSQGRRITLVDTPGFNDTNLSDLVVLELIANWLKQTWVYSIVWLIFSA